MADHQLEIIGGVDTHAETHTAAVIDEVGRMLGYQQFPATVAGYRTLLAWMRQHGVVRSIGIEGTGSYGVGLARYLRARGVQVVDVDRPNRKMRRQRGKSDPIDAEAAARAVLAGTATTTPKNRDGQVEAIRVIRAARASAVKSRTAAFNALVGMIRTAPEPLRTQLIELRGSSLVMVASALRPALDVADPVAATKTALRRLARRIRELDSEIRAADLDLHVLLTQAAPRLMELPGVGPEVAAQLLITAGDNPERIRDERAFATLCGVSPIPASSGRTDRHRLNRGGDRMANRALYFVAINRMRCHGPTQAYVERRRGQGLSNRDIARCLKRYIARQVCPLILASMMIRPPSPKALAGL